MAIVMIYEGTRREAPIRDTQRQLHFMATKNNTKRDDRPIELFSIYTQDSNTTAIALMMLTFNHFANNEGQYAAVHQVANFLQ